MQPSDAVHSEQGFVFTSAVDLRPRFIHSMTVRTTGAVDGLPATPSSPLLSNDSFDRPVYTLYSSRFLILFTFSLLSFNQSLFWLTFSPISDKTMQYYDVSIETVNLLLNWGPILYIITAALCFWVSSLRGGLRKTVLCSSTICTIAMCLRVVPNILWDADSTVFKSNAIWIIHAAQIMNAAAGPLVMGTVSQCSCLWFGVNERARATSIAVFANNLGGGIGFLQMTNQIDSASQIPRILYTHAAMAIAASVLTLAYFPAFPKTPPSHAAELIMFPPHGSEESSNFRTSIAALGVHFVTCLRNRSFFLIAMIGGGVLGTFTGWSSLFNNILGPIICTDPTTTCDLNYVSKIAGWIGFSSTLSAVVGGVMMGAIADTPRFRRRFKLLLYTSSALSFITYLYFLLCTQSPIFPNPPLSATQFTLGFTITAFGLALGSLNPLYYELGAEITYPVPGQFNLLFVLTSSISCFIDSLSSEFVLGLVCVLLEQYSAGIVALWNNALGLVFIFAQPYFSAGFMNCTMMLAVILAGLLLIPIKEEYRRRDDDEQKHRSDMKVQTEDWSVSDADSDADENSVNRWGVDTGSSSDAGEKQMWNNHRSSSRIAKQGLLMD